MKIDRDKIKYLTAARLLYLLIKNKSSCTNHEVTMALTHNILNILFNTGLFEILSNEEENIVVEYIEQVNKIMIQKFGTIGKEEGNA